MDFAIGKWISPYLGFRLSAMGGALHTNWPLAEGVMTHMRYAAVYGDIMWNMFNTFHGYNEDRVFSIIPLPEPVVFIHSIILHIIIKRMLSL